MSAAKQIGVVRWGFSWGRPGLLLGGLVLVCGLVCPQGVRGQSDLLPRPEALEEAVEFWVRVYTEVDTDNGYLHDPWHLSVIYDISPKERRVRNARRDEIQADLRVLASGQRRGLSREQRRLLALWPDDVSNETLAAAAGRVRWQLGQSDRFREGMRRSGAYRAHIERVIRDKGMPPELVVLPHVESSFTPHAVSSAAATGMWQFGRATGRRFMQIDHIVDVRLDPYMTTEHAMSLLQFNYNVLGTWPLALTAYNHGANGIARAKQRTGSDDIAVIVAEYRGRAFGFASRNFYAQFLAALEVDENYRQYFGELRFDEPPEFVEVRTDAYISADAFADAAGVSLRQLRADNPALRQPVWDGSKLIPAGFLVKLRADAMGDSSRDRRRAGSRLLSMIDDEHKFDAQFPDVEYIVQRGDVLSRIAVQFRTSVNELVALNGLRRNGNFIREGQRLLLPQNGDASLLAAADEGEAGSYIVRSGDYLSRIAARYGVTIQALQRANNLRDPRRIYPGQRLIIPGAGGPDLSGAEPQPAVIAAAATRQAPPAPAAAPDEAVVVPEATEGSPPATEQPASLTDEEINTRLSELLAADPSDYSVAADNSIEIHASETLGHYADWLGIRAQDLRRLNRMNFHDFVIIGERLSLDFSRVAAAEFELRRRRFHSALQQEFFASYRIRDVENYQVQSGDNIGSIARETYSVPIWLLRQYNPGLEINHILPGQQVVLPLVEPVQ